MNISIIKTLLGISFSDNSLDMLLDYLLRITEARVKNYCNRVDIPSELELIVIQMTADLYVLQYKSTYDELKNKSEPEAGTKNLNNNSNRQIKKESIGDYSVEYESLPKTNQATVSSKVIPVDSVLTDYTSQLKRFRKIKL